MDGTMSFATNKCDIAADFEYELTGVHKAGSHLCPLECRHMFSSLNSLTCPRSFLATQHKTNAFILEVHALRRVGAVVMNAEAVNVYVFCYSLDARVNDGDACSRFVDWTCPCHPHCGPQISHYWSYLDSYLSKVIEPVLLLL
ncbi:hypothetical protein Y032_0163g3464 [Ancylostoma ceylanicum]|uniref:Uncharacterized protein n=1 Tax=Ancylostoma ceylanicum TaxID=53326 RepID=A0A016SXH6_9BILA|nr:hypothetical protein Y032_0163g3464 [Ancylostoma ceylanicum]